MRAKSRNRRSEIQSRQVIGTSAASPIDLGGGREDQVPVGIEGAEEAGFVEPHGGLYALERIFAHEERGLHCAVVSPKPHRPARGVVAATLVGKPQGHRLIIPAAERASGVVPSAQAIWAV